MSRAEERRLALRPAPVPLADLADRAATVVRPRYQAGGVTLTVRSPRPGPTVNADTDRLLEAVMNLLDNALRHTPTGGEVTLTVDTIGPGPGEPAVARLTVTDTGTGFTADQAPHLFERFYRTDPGRSPDPASGPSDTWPTTGNAPGRRGSGIGLTISQAIVEAHHGQIRAHSDGPGRGACFTLTLPMIAGRDHRLGQD